MLTDAKSFLIFSFVGAATAGIYFLSLAVLLEILNVDYRLAVTVSYALALAFHFLANKLITFDNKVLSGSAAQLIRYAIFAAFNYLLIMAIVMLTVEKLHRSPQVGLLLSTCVTVVVGYLLSKHWIFARAENEK